MCLAQGHNAVTQVRFEPATPLSRDKHSTTEFPTFECHSEPSFKCLQGKIPQNLQSAAVMNGAFKINDQY